MSSSNQVIAQNPLNPFASSKPVTEPSRFYGRRSDIQRIYTRIGAERPQSISIIGEKVIGKSSLLNILAHQDTKERLLSEPDHHLYGHLQLLGQEDWTPERFLWTLTDTLRQKHPDLPEASDYDSFRALILHLNSENFPLIAFFDDFNVITRNPDFQPTFFSFLRSMANTYNVAYVTTSSDSLQRLCVSKDVEESPFFNIFTNITLKPLNENDVRQWVIEGSNPSGVSLSSEADWIYQQVGGFPELIRILCALLWERKQARGKLSGNELTEVENIFQNEIQRFFESLWESFSEREQEVCDQLLKSKEIDRSQNHLVRELVRRGYVNEADGGYLLFGNAFERFLAAKAGLEISTEQTQKKRWWKFGK